MEFPIKNEDVTIEISPSKAEPNLIQQIKKFKHVENAAEPMDSDRQTFASGSKPPPPSYEESLKQPTVSVGKNPIVNANQTDNANASANDDQVIEIVMFEPFETQIERQRFVQRVYMILAIQLGFSAGLILLTTFVADIKVFFIQNYLVMLTVSSVVFMVTMIMLLCCESLRRSFPINIILLMILTAAMATFTTLVTVVYKTEIVLYAMGTTALVCFLISLIAIQTKVDITQCSAILCVLSLIFILYGLIVMILYLCGIKLKILHIIFSAIAVTLFSLYLMYDTQQVMGGKRYEIRPNEYIYGAVLLYIDIMYIFIYILHLLGYCNES